MTSRVLGVENPIGRDADEFDRRWNELADQLESEMGVEPGETSSADLGPDRLDGRDGPSQGDGVDRALEALAGGVDPWADAPGLGHSPPGPRDWAEPEEGEHFEPPKPPPVTAGEPLLVVAWAATIVGLVGLAIVVVVHLATPWFVPRALALLGFAGIATLIWRMPHKRSDSNDNGAQV